MGLSNNNVTFTGSQRVTIHPVTKNSVCVNRANSGTELIFDVPDSYAVLFNHSDSFTRKFRTTIPWCSRLINRQRVYSIWIVRGWFGEERELGFLNPVWFLRLSEALQWVKQWTITFDQPHSLLPVLKYPEWLTCGPEAGCTRLHRAWAPVSQWGSPAVQGWEFWKQTETCQNLSLALSSYVTLGYFLNLSLPQCSSFVNISL